MSALIHHPGKPTPCTAVFKLKVWPGPLHKNAVAVDAAVLRGCASVLRIVVDVARAVHALTAIV